MSRSYYEKRDATAMLAKALMKLPEWQVHGFKEDKSDIQTDYFDPASWYGYAIGPNGFIVVSGMYGSAKGTPVEGKPFPKGATWALYSPDGVLIRMSKCAKKLDRLEYAYSEEEKAKRAFAVAQEIVKMNEAIMKATAKALGLRRGRLTNAEKTFITDFSGQAKIERNEARGGMEVRFPAKPDETMIEWLKANGFRWSPRQCLWYAKYDEAIFAAVEKMLAGPAPAVQAEEPTPEEQAAMEERAYAAEAAEAAEGRELGRDEQIALADEGHPVPQPLRSVPPEFLAKRDAALAALGDLGLYPALRVLP